jgi:glycerol-3-phosphate dehydrogenase
VLLLDHGDFAGGTSQASGMMIWGGLLYLKDFDLPTVIKLCRARDKLIAELPDRVRTQRVCYLPGRQALRNRHVVRAGMLLYWLLGSRSRGVPRSGVRCPELELLAPGRFRTPLTVEEAVLSTSDCRFALDWILANEAETTPVLNHCLVENARFVAKRWKLDLRDRLHGQEISTTCKFIINAAGVWTDNVNRQLGLESPYEHQLSKGVYLSFRRPESLRQILVFDTGENRDLVTFVPWGPVAMYGPTETPVADLEQGFQTSADDVRALLQLANQNLRKRYGSEDVVSMRCGVRPLAVRRGHSAGEHPSALSRKHLVHYDEGQQAVAVYGGKLTSCGVVAQEIVRHLSRSLEPRHPMSGVAVVEPRPTVSFPGLSEAVASPEWCRDREHCHTLEDYLRRRTNIAQWIRRGGLGLASENRETLSSLARVFCTTETGAEAAVAAYERSVQERHDAVLAAV